jgi:hypothetical protein
VTSEERHQGVSREQLAYYLDEFTFRFNRRTSASRGLLFYRLLQQCTNTDPAALKDLVIPHETGRKIPGNPGIFLPQPT